MIAQNTYTTRSGCMILEGSKSPTIHNWAFPKSIEWHWERIQYTRKILSMIQNMSNTDIYSEQNLFSKTAMILYSRGRNVNWCHPLKWILKFSSIFIFAKLSLFQQTISLFVITSQDDALMYLFSGPWLILYSSSLDL